MGLARREGAVSPRAVSPVHGGAVTSQTVIPERAQWIKRLAFHNDFQNTFHV